MNMDYVYTDEFGEQQITNDTSKGIPTTTVARFRFGLDFEDRKKATAKYLVPNIREFNPDIVTGLNTRYEYSMGMLATYQFSDVFEDYINVLPPLTSVTFDTTNYTTSVKNHKKDLMLGTNNNGIPEDYFYKFTYAKVYTVSSFQGTHYETARRDAFLGVKQIRPKEEEDCSAKINYFPTNFGFKNRRNFGLILSTILLFLQFALSIILVKVGELIGAIFYDLSRLFTNIPILKNLFERFSQKLENAAYNIQTKFTQILPITTYPDCEECSQDDESISTDITYTNTYCRVSEVKMKVNNFTISAENLVLLYVLDATSTNNFSSSTNAGTTLIPEFFFGESSKSSDTECSSIPVMAYSDLDNLHTYSVNIPNDSNTAKYYADIYATTAGTSVAFGNFVAFFNSDNTNDTDVRFYVDSGSGKMTTAGLGNGKYIEFTYDEWYRLTGIDYTNTTVDDTNTYAVLRIYERGVLINTSTNNNNTIDIEQGCSKYDSVFDESIVKTYLWGNTSAYGNPTDPLDPPTYTDGFQESISKPLGKTLVSTIIGGSDTLRLPYKKTYADNNNVTYDRRTKSGLSEFRDGVFTIIPVIQGRSNNTQAIREWYRRKRINLQFCGGVINYSFIDNWLNGVLYFFKFDKRIKWDNQDNYDLGQRRSKFPRELIFFNILDNNFYYRCTPYKFQNNIGEFIGQQFFKISNVYQKQILHPTTFYDLGPRDTFLYEICTDSSIDPQCSVIRDISNTSYQDPGNVVEYALNYRLDINNANINIDDFFSGTQYGSNIKTLDGDITQMISINCEAGIEEFDLDSPHYFIYNTEIMDPEDNTFASYFKKNGQFGPLPIDFKFDDNGSFIRTCLNYRLGDFSQKVPFYLWDKLNDGFGSYGTNSDLQKWDRENIATMKLQRIFSISSYNATTTNYLMADGEEEYLLKPMTITHPTYAVSGNYEDALERFDIISNIAPDTSTNGAIEFNENELWLHVLTFTGTDYRKNPTTGDIYVVVNKTWVKQSQQYVSGTYETFLFQTHKNYSGNKQVLSTPFHFYFGITPGKTSFDKFIKYFGPKDAFKSVN